MDIKENDLPKIFHSAGNLSVAAFCMARVRLGKTLRSMDLDQGIMGSDLDLRKSLKCHLMPWRGPSLTTTVSKSQYLNVIIPILNKSQYFESVNNT